MAGFTIHLAIGKRYIEKHKEEIKNTEEFLKGIIAPDMNEQMIDIEQNKSKSHYGKWGNYCTNTDICKFLQDTHVDINQDYWKGYFLHLLTDHYFYNIDFKNEQQTVIENKDRMYNDYDLLNEGLIQKYQVDKIERNRTCKKIYELYKRKTKIFKAR